MTKSPIAESNTLAYRGNKPDEARRFTNGRNRDFRTTEFAAILPGFSFPLFAVALGSLEGGDLRMANSTAKLTEGIL